MGASVVAYRGESLSSLGAVGGAMTTMMMMGSLRRSMDLSLAIRRRANHSWAGGGPSSKKLMMMVMMNGVQVQQQSPAIIVEEKCYTYGHLLSSALHLSASLTTPTTTTPLHPLQAGHFQNIRTKPTNEALKVTMKAFGNLDGARIGIMAKPCAEFVAAMWATWLCNGVAVPLSLSYPESELLHVLFDADISIVMGTQEYQDQLEAISKKGSAQFFLLPDIPTSASDSTNSEESEMVENGTSEEDFLLSEDSLVSSIRGDTPALIVYTSGTTGKPKGVVHTHSGIASQVEMLSKAWEYRQSDRFLHCLPLHHVHGLFNGLLAPLYAGALVEFVPRFNFRGVWRKWRESYLMEGSKYSKPITVFTGVPTMYALLLRGFESMDKESKIASSSAAEQLRLMMCGSSALPIPIMAQWEKLTGHRLLERYGMTEFVMALSNPLHGERRPGTVGKPLPGVQVKILSEDPSAPGVGELCVKSPSMFKEYWRKPEMTKDSFTEDGFFKTGDTVTVDEKGYYVILGRSSVDIIKVGGFKLSALEIEATLLEHPAVAECAILGLPHQYFGEVICAIVVPTEEAKSEAEGKLSSVLSLYEIQSWVRNRLAPYKVPAQLNIWEKLPRNAMGKVNKKELKQVILTKGDKQ